MNELLKSYQEILRALAYETNDTGDIYVNIGGELTRPTVEDGLPLVLPTTENIRSTTTVTSDGKIIKCKAIFNPYKESAIGDTESITWLRTEILTCINQMTAVAVQYLLRLMVSNDHKNNVGEYSSDFLAYVGIHADDKSIKLDEATFNKWDQIILNSFDPDTEADSLISLITHRRTKINEGKYTAYARININILDEINKQLENKEGAPNIYKLKCRKDELRAYKLILDYLFNVENYTYPYTYETEVIDSPLTVAMLELYNIVTKIPYNIIKELYHLQESFGEGIPLITDKRRKQLISRATIDAIPALVKTAESILDSNEKKVNKEPVLAAIDPNKGRVLNAEQRVTPVQSMQQVTQQNPVVQQGFQQPIVTSPQTQIQAAQASEKSDLCRLKEASRAPGNVWLPVQSVPVQQYPQQVPVQYYAPVQNVVPQQQYAIGGMNNGYNQGYNGYNPVPNTPYPVYQDPFKQQQPGPGVILGNLGYNGLM